MFEKCHGLPSSLCQVEMGLPKPPHGMRESFVSDSELYIGVQEMRELGISGT